MKKSAFVFVAIIAIAISLASCGKPTAADITADCIEMIKDGDWKGYVNTFDMPDEEKAQLQQMFEKKGKETIENMDGIDSYDIIEETISEDGNEAVVKAMITYGNGKEEESTFYYTNINGEWKQKMNK